jgi:Uncharacterized protein conserved in bacteria C-term(DUF2220)/Uncharacterized protein conserved in bacteria N-term (DUF3322)
VNRITAGTPGVAFLERLLILSERNPDRTRPASAAPDYDELRTADMVAQFEARMLAAERVGAISVRKGKRERRHLIERVIVVDPVALARHLGRTPSGVTANQSKAVLEPIAAGGEPWVLRVLEEMASRWSRGEAAFRLLSDDTVLAREFIALLVAISKDQARGLDGRTFSLKTTGDTKAFDRHSTRIAGVLGTQFGEPGMGADLVWNRIGLERFGHPVHLKGCVVVEDKAGVLVHGRAVPFASIHPEMLRPLRLCGHPTALLTIENYASFNRQVREIDDGALVVYTGGFASVGVVELLTSLLKSLDPGVPFFHWGDIDPGGLRIFRFLEETLPRAPRPHLMNRAVAQTQGRPASRDPTLGSMAKTNSALFELAQWLAHGEQIKHLEQEALDPCSPVLPPQPRSRVSVRTSPSQPALQTKP